MFLTTQRKKGTVKCIILVLHAKALYTAKSFYKKLENIHNILSDDSNLVDSNVVTFVKNFTFRLKISTK